MAHRPLEERRELRKLRMQAKRQMSARQALREDGSAEAMKQYKKLANYWQNREGGIIRFKTENPSRVKWESV